MSGSEQDGVAVVVGVDGAGRTHRLAAIVGTAPTVRIMPIQRPDEVIALLPAGSAGVLVTVDDAHRIEPSVLRLLTVAARSGVPMILTRRPTIDSPELADLEAAVAARGVVAELSPLSDAQVAQVLSRDTPGRAADLDRVEEIRQASAGVPVWVVALAGAAGPAQVRARVARQLGRLAVPMRRLATVLSLDLDLADDTLAAASDTHLAELAPALRALTESGLIAPGTEGLIPAVAAAVRELAGPAELRRARESVARAVPAGEPLRAAEQWHAARPRSAAAAQAYLAAGEQLRFVDPEAAAVWFDRAVDAGADPGEVAAGRAETAILLGRPVDLDGPVTPVGAARLSVAGGVAAAHQGRAARAAAALLASPTPGPVLAVPALVATGSLERARTVPIDDSAVALSGRRLASAALTMAADPAAAVSVSLEAAELWEQAGAVGGLLPDTPHAVAAVLAVTAGDTATAEHQLTRAIDSGVGGPAAVVRHRLLLAWVRLRAGSYGTARSELARLRDMPLPGREAMLLTALEAGLARRSGDVALLDDAWQRAQPMLARRAVDLLTAEIVEELLVAATRLRELHSVRPVLADLEQMIAGLGRPAVWSVTVGWIRLQVAVAADDPVAAAAAVDALPLVDGPAELAGRQRAQCVAAGVWADALSGAVDAVAVLSAADELAAVRLPWEASRLCGQAAIRVRDSAAARQLLERARDLAEPVGGDAPGGLTEREVQVGRLLLAGHAHKEISAQLFISPKTIEKHVANMRRKLGVTTRAEFSVALRGLLDGRLSDGRLSGAYLSDG